MAAAQRVASALDLDTVDAILRVVEMKAVSAKTVGQAVEAVRDARRGLADIRVEVEAEEILMAAAEQEGGPDGF